MRKNFLVDTRQGGKEASKQLDFSPQTLFILLVSYFSDVSCTFHLGKLFIRFLSIIFYIYILQFGSTTFVYYGKTLALKNFSFRENWVGSEVAGMKIAFLPFLTQHGPTFWPKKGQNMEFLKQNLNFESLRKTGVILLPSMWLKDSLTKVKIVTFWAHGEKVPL